MLCLSRLFHACLLFTQDVNCDSFIALITLPVPFARLQEVIAASLPLQLPSLVPGTSLLASLLAGLLQLVLTTAASIPPHPVSPLGLEARGINLLSDGVGAQRVLQHPPETCSPSSTPCLETARCSRASS